MTKNKKILIIEDDLFVRELYENIFRKKGYDVVSAADGEEGLNKALTEKADLILLDIMLPVKSGMEVLKTLRKSSTSARKTPVFLLTNLGQESIIKEAFNLGVDGYLLKVKLLPYQIVSEVENFFKGETNREFYLKN